MAQTGFTPIITYHSTTGSAVPDAANLAPGEMALNIADMKLYAENSSGVVTLLASAAGSSGDVVGPASATDNAVVRFDQTTGKLVQNSAVTIADTTGDITGGAYNKVTITAPATSAALTIADGKTLTANNSLTLAGTDATTMTFPSTSATIARTDAGQTFTGTQVMTSPRIVTSINDTNGNEVFGITATGSAVNELTVANAATGNNPTISATGSDTNIGITLTPKGTGGVVFPAGAVGTPAITTSGDTNTGIFFPAADTIAFAEGGAEAMRIDSSGNLGLGVTPSAWFSTWKAIQVGASGSLASRTDVFGTLLSNNAFINSAGNNAYIGTGAASQYSLIGNEHRWFTAPSGTAGNAISFTQAMTLDASGRLAIGTTSIDEQFRLNGSSNANARIRIQNQGTDICFLGSALGIIGLGNANDLFLSSAGSTNLLLGTNGSERARITSGGILYVNSTDNGLTSALKLSVTGATGEGAFLFKNDAGDSQWTGWVWNTATSGNNLFINFLTEGGSGTGRGSISYNRAGGLLAYNTTSDYRAKDIIGPVQNPGAIVDALRVYEGVMKGATQSRPMLIAHEAQVVAPYAVTGEKDAVNENGDPIYQQMDVSSLVPLLLAEVQSLRKRVAELESK